MSTYQFNLQRVLPPLASGLGLLSLGGGLLGLSNPQGFSEVLGIPVSASTSTALPFLQFVAARNVCSGVTVFTLLYVGQRKVVGVYLMCGVTVGMLDAWICAQNSAEGKAIGHALTAVVVGLIGAGMYWG